MACLCRHAYIRWNSIITWFMCHAMDAYVANPAMFLVAISFTTTLSWRANMVCVIWAFIYVFIRVWSAFPCAHEEHLLTHVAVHVFIVAYMRWMSICIWVKWSVSRSRHLRLKFTADRSFHPVSGIEMWSAAEKMLTACEIQLERAHSSHWQIVLLLINAEWHLAICWWLVASHCSDFIVANVNMPPN